MAPPGRDGLVAKGALSMVVGACVTAGHILEERKAGRSCWNLRKMMLSKW